MHIFNFLKKYFENFLKLSGVLEAPPLDLLLGRLPNVFHPNRNPGSAAASIPLESFLLSRNRSTRSPFPKKWAFSKYSRKSMDHGRSMNHAILNKSSPVWLFLKKENFSCKFRKNNWKLEFFQNSVFMYVRVEESGTNES